jgi:uncharacterized protein YutD
MLTTFDRKISIHRWINCTKLQSLIVPGGISVSNVNTAYDREKLNDPIRSVLYRRLYLTGDWLDNSSSKGFCMLSRFQSHFRSEMITGDSMKALRECRRLLKEFRTWVCSIISRY